MTEAPENATTAAPGAPESQAYQIPYLTPTPPGFSPEYDYCAVLQSLLDTASGTSPNFSDSSPFQPPNKLMKDWKRYSCRAHLVSSFGSTEWSWLDQLSPDITVERMYEQIQDVRQTLTGGTEWDTRVLVVDEFSRDFLQILGAAIDLDPTFLWRHYNEDLDSDHYAPDMAGLLLL